MSEEGFSLDASLKSLGAIQPVVVDAHGNLVDGAHRKELSADLPVYRNEAIQTPLQLSYARLAANTVRRKVSDEEVSDRLSEIYEETRKAEGEFPSPLVVARSLGRSQDWVLKHLPERYKSPAKVSAGQAGGAASAVSRQAGDRSIDEKEFDLRLSAIGFTRLKSGAFADAYGVTFTQQTFRAIHPEVFDPDFRVEAREPLERKVPAPARAEPYARGVSPQRGSMTQRAFTKPALLLMEYLHAAGLRDLRAEVEFKRDGEVNSQGVQKGYVADLLSESTKTVFEAEGAGSSSRDNEMRDDFFRHEGYVVLHVSNDHIRRYGTELAQIVAALLRRPG